MKQQLGHNAWPIKHISKSGLPSRITASCLPSAKKCCQAAWPIQARTALLLTLGKVGSLYKDGLPESGDKTFCVMGPYIQCPVNRQRGVQEKSHCDQPYTCLHPSAVHLLMRKEEDDYALIVDPV
mmetsp:Transcript_14923/g.42893  ORF Transcript_14923/g.42893 Transcript_14923/m.42893 type:complete len:125 (+) Transcript_14923:1639-2013(+)